MAKNFNNRALAVSQKIYGRLLLAYPKAHREEYGPAMAQLFRDECRDAWNESQSWGVARLWLRVLPDLVKTSITERLAALNTKQNTNKHMNKKLIAWVSVAVVAGILLLWTVLRHSPFGQSHNFGNDTIGIMLALLALPMRLYVIFVSGENGSWSLPVLILFLGLSGLMWGLIVERVVWMLSKRKHTQ
jgi:hypothetical protein